MLGRCEFIGACVFLVLPLSLLFIYFVVPFSKVTSCHVCCYHTDMWTHSIHRIKYMSCFFQSSLCLCLLLSFFSMLSPLWPLFCVKSLLSINDSSFHHLLPLLFPACVGSSTILSSLHSFIPSSLVLIYSPATHARSVWSELPGIIYCLMAYSMQLTPAQRYFALFIDFHSFCLSVCVYVCVWVSDCVCVQEKHTLKKGYKAQGRPAHLSCWWNDLRIERLIDLMFEG